MKTCRLNKTLDKKQIIDILYNSSGYYTEVSREIYNEYSVDDEVIFNCKFNHANLRGNIYNKHITPSTTFKSTEDERTYVFFINLMVKIEVICL